MKLYGQSCQPPVTEPDVRVPQHPALPVTKSLIRLLDLYFTFPVFLVNGYPSPLTKLVLIHYYRYPYMDKMDKKDSLNIN